MGKIRIALIGKSGAGKSAASRYLIEKHSFVPIRTGAICRQISQLLFGNEAKASTQSLDDVLTKIDPCIFLRASLRGADLSGDVVVDALRFSEDLELVRNSNFKTLRVISPDNIRIERLKERGQEFDNAIQGLHRSETELDSCAVDFEISNDGTRFSLEAALDSVIRGLR